MTRRRVELEYAATGGQALEGRFRSLGESGERAMGRLRQSVQPVNPALRAVDASAREMRGTMESLTARMGPLGSVLRGLGPAGLAAGAALGGTVLAVRRLAQAGEQAERQQLRLQAMLRATQQVSGQTAASIEEMAVALGRDTLASVREARDVATQMLAYTSISGENFERTLRLSQDLAELGFGSLSSASRALGRALEDPERGLDSLRRMGVTFNATQREQIRLMMEVGDQAGAHGLILSELEERIGGTGAGAAQGLSGAWDTLNENIGLFIERMAEASRVTEGMEWLFGTMGRGVGRAADSLGEDRTSQRIVAATREVAELEDELARARSNELTSPATIASIEEELAEARGRADRLLAEARERAQVERAERQQAEEAQGRAEAEARAGQILTIEERLEEQRLALRENALEKLRRAEEKEIGRLQTLRAQSDDPEEIARIDGLIADRRALTERQIAERNAAAERAAERQAEAEARRAEQQRARNMEVLAGLEREIELLGIADQRERARLEAQDRAAGRLRDASPEAVARARSLAGRLYDEQQAEQEAAAVESAIERMRGQLAGLERAQGGAVAALESWRAETLASLDETAEGYAEFAGLVEDIYRRRLPEARGQDLASARDWRSGAIRGLGEIAEAAGDAATQVEQVFGRAFRGLEDGLADTIMRGKADWRDLIMSLTEDFVRMQIRMAVINPLASGMQRLMDAGSTTAAVAHSGGVIGQSALPPRRVPAALFEGAPRYHGGGIAGLAPDERPAVLRVGEEVLTADNPRHRRNAGPAQNITINVSAPGGDPAQVRRSIGRASLELARVVARGQRNL